MPWDDCYPYDDYDLAFCGDPQAEAFAAMSWSKGMDMLEEMCEELGMDLMPSRLCSGRSKYRTRGGSVAHARPAGRGPSARPRRGYKGRAPVRRCSTWRRSGPR